MRSRLVTFLFTTAMLTVIAVTIGSTALFFCALCMAFMLLLGLSSAAMAIITMKAEVRRSVPRVERGSAILIGITTRFVTFLPVSHMLVELSFPGISARGVKLRAGERPFTRASFQYEMECPHRGVFEIGVSRYIVTDLFGLFRFTKNTAGATVRVEVAPRLLNAEAIALCAGDTGPEEARRTPDDPSSPSGIRAWQDGDLLKRIHWKITMKHYEPDNPYFKPTVRVYDESARPDTLIMPDLSPVDAVPERALSIEDAVCEACLGIARAQLTENDPVVMPLSAMKPVEVTGRSIHDLHLFTEALTAVDFDSELSFDRVLMQTGRRIDRTGAIVLVTPKLTMRVADLAIQLRRMGNVSVLVIWITDTRRAEAEELMTMLELADVAARRDDPFAERG